MGIERKGCNGCLNKTNCIAPERCLSKLAPTYICDCCGKEFKSNQIRQDGDLIYCRDCYKKK